MKASALAACVAATVVVLASLEAAAQESAVTPVVGTSAKPAYPAAPYEDARPADAPHVAAYEDRDERGSPRRHAVDPLLPAAIAETGVGVALGVVGVATLAPAYDAPERCGRIAGCVAGPVDTAADLQGRYLIGAGIGMAAAGGLTWALLEGAPLEPGEHRDSGGRAVAGSVLVSLGASGVGAIVAAGTSPQDHVGVDVLIGMVALPSLAVGIPLLATSADRETEAEEAEERAAARALEEGTVRDANPGMYQTGITLTVVGGVGLAGGSALLMGGLASKNYEPAIAGFLIGAPSVALLGVGIPLAAVGGRDVPADQAAAAPVVRAGPGSISVTGQF